VMSCGDNFLIKSLNALLRASPPVAGVEWVCGMFVLVVVNLNSDDYSDREIDIFSANQIPAFWTKLTPPSDVSSDKNSDVNWYFFMSNYEKTPSDSWDDARGWSCVWCACSIDWVLQHVLINGRLPISAHTWFPMRV
jgi:hypothetical protein